MHVNYKHRSHKLLSKTTDVKKYSAWFDGKMVSSVTQKL